MKTMGINVMKLFDKVNLSDVGYPGLTSFGCQASPINFVLQISRVQSWLKPMK